MEINFNLKNSEIYQRIEAQKLVFPSFFEGLRILTKFLIIFFLILLLFYFGQERVFKNNIFGAFIISFSFWIFLELQRCFLNLKIKSFFPRIKLEDALKEPFSFNFAEFLEFDAAKTILEAEKIARDLKLPFLTPPIFITHLKRINSSLYLFVFERLIVKEKLNIFLQDYCKNYKNKSILDFKEIIIDSAKLSLERGKNQIGIGELVAISFKKDPLLNKFLVENNLKESDVTNLVFVYEKFLEKKEKVKRFWEYENLLRHGSIGSDWAAGYTYFLNQFSIDWTENIKKWTFKEIIGHQKEIYQTERILCREGVNNVLIVGEPGTGRKSIVEAIAFKSFFGNIHQNLKYKRVVELDLISLFSYTQDIEQAEVLLDTIFREVKQAGNVILVLDDIHNFVGFKEKKTGTMDIVPLLSKYLSFSEFRLIALTDYTNLHTVLEQFPSFLNLFEKVEVEEISLEETLQVLMNYSLEVEKKRKILVSYPALREIINLTDRYFPTIPFPQKALGILDEVVVYVCSLKEKVILPQHVASLISEKIQIPVGEVQKNEREILLNLESLIHQRVINQEEAVEEISEALRRARAGLQPERKKPIGTFIFLGPTGVGKTETAKALAEAYFGREERMIRLDMSEFQAIEDIPRLLGKPGQEGLLTTAVRENPFSLLLLDEIEKAHPNILNLFLQVFDEGWITDGQGRKVIFTNNIIIGTSNAGAQLIWEIITKQKKLSIVKNDLIDWLLKNNVFRPEFINRCDAVIVFKPLDKKNLLDIAHLKLSKLAKGLKEQGIEFEITQELKEKIAEISYRPEFGAREMNRVIQDKVENVLARAILSGQLKRQDKVKINPQDFSLEIIRPQD